MGWRPARPVRGHGRRPVVMNKGALFMIHKAWTFAYGNSDELVATADLLDKIDGTLVQTYADRTKQDPKTIENGCPPKRGSLLMRRCPMASPTASRRTRQGSSPRGTSAPTAGHRRSSSRPPNPNTPVDAAAMLRRLDVAALTA